ncbi:hypothetical protein ADUPG1_007044, partial [Aduncisulcus paluster]
ICALCLLSLECGASVICHLSKLYQRIHVWKPEWKYLDIVLPMVDKLLEGHPSLVHAKRGVPGLDEEVCGSLSMKPVTSPSPFTFLVSNSQLPEKLKAMPPPVTQLYLSVDAADPDTLAEIDRPYVGKTDAWRRLNESSVHFIHPSREDSHPNHCLYAVLYYHWLDYLVRTAATHRSCVSRRPGLV